MKKLLKKVLLVFGGIYLAYAVVILGCKFYYDHPHLVPSVSVGKIDDWQYDPGHSGDVYYDDRSAWEKLTDLQTISQHWGRYLLVGLFAAIAAAITTLILVALYRSLRLGIAQIRARERVARKTGWTHVLVVLPFICLLLRFALAIINEYWVRSWRVEEFLGWCGGFLMLAFFGSVLYLFVTGIFNWGSENVAIKKLGKKRFFWSLGYGLLPVGLFVLVFIFSARYMSFGSSDLSVNTFTTNDSISLSTVNQVKTSGMSMNSLAMPQMATDNIALGEETIGLAVGGANDVNNFRENIKNGYLPEPTDLSYEGLFYDYYFDTGAKETCDKLFCPSYFTAVSPDPYTGEDQYYLSVGLNSGIKESDFARRKLNLMVVMDISGSMSSSFDNYYYDGGRGGDDDRRTKMAIANETLVNLTEHLQDDDRLSVVLFDDRAYLAKPFRAVRDTDMTAIQGHILDIRPRGGTNMSAGIQEAIDEFAKINYRADGYENRIIFITDAMPNSGETSESGLFGMIRKLSLDGIYTTFVGVGVDLNTELVSELTKVRGANYYSVHSALDFKRRLADEFEFMVTPLVFDLDLVVEAPGYEIVAVYGSPEADQATGKIMTVNTLFPSASSGGENRGGLILLQLQKRPGATNQQVSVRTSYLDRDGNRGGESKSFTFSGTPDEFPNTGIHKGVLLTRYASVLGDWMLDSRYDELTRREDKLRSDRMHLIGPEYYHDQGIRPVCWPVRDGRWERGSRPLRVSEDYVEIFQTLRDYFAAQVPEIGDDELLQEVDILDYLIAKGRVDEDLPVHVSE